jgi:redox-sensitive bicupin YhaK (pirin superfamily)
MEYRKVDKVVVGRPAVDGAGVKLVRVIGHDDTADFDPFLLLDAFDSADTADYLAGFPWHPHRGIETVTFLAAGRIEHGDSLGNSGVIGAGDCQWMTAGKGILHQELPKMSPRLFGLQLWLNLPAADKMSPPRYRDLAAAAVPVVETRDARVRVIAGVHAGTAGAMRGDYVDATFLDIELAGGGVFETAAAPGDTVFVYILEGSLAGEAGGELYGKRRALRFGPGDAVRLAAAPGAAARCVLFAGAPLRQPIAWGGPIVMNTKAELDHAFRELDEGTFIR